MRLGINTDVYVGGPPLLRASSSDVEQVVQELRSWLGAVRSWERGGQLFGGGGELGVCEVGTELLVGDVRFT